MYIIEKSAGQSPFLTSKHPTKSGFPLKFLIVYAVEECIFKGMSPLKVANLRFPPLISVDFQSMENKILPCFIPKFQAPHMRHSIILMHGKISDKLIM